MSDLMLSGVPPMPALAGLAPGGPPGLAAPPELPPELPPEGEEEVTHEQSSALTDDELQGLFRDYLHEADQYGDRLDSAAAEATRAYMAEKFGDEQPGRSQIVLSVVRDTVRAALPSILRAVVGSLRPAEFVERTPAEAAAATQATDWAYYATFVANSGWLCFHDAILDALTRRVGWLRWWWEDYGPPATETYDALLAPQLAELLGQDGVQPLSIARRRATQAEMAVIAAGPAGASLATMPGIPVVLHRATITRRRPTARPCLRAIAAELVRVTPDGTGGRDGEPSATFVRTPLRVSDLVQRGLPLDDVLAAAGAAAPRMNQRVTRARDRAAAGVPRTSPKVDPSMRTVTLIEGWFHADVDGDGIAELLYGEAVGESPVLLRWQRADHVPLSALSALREPHRIVGLSLSDMTQDLQQTQSRVMRAILDSLMSSIFPRTVVVEGQASIEDVLNTEVGAVIRASTNNAVTELGKPFIGGEALPILMALDQAREQRTGITKASQGLSAEALQSTTGIAVAAQVSAAQDRLEHMARTIAETGLRDVYQGMVRLMAVHQPRAQVAKLRGHWVELDPASWRDGFNFQCNVASRGATQERLAALAGVLTQQKEIIAQLGADNPIVPPARYRDTLAEMAELALNVEPSRYFGRIPGDWLPPQQPPQPSPEQVLAQIEQQKVLGNLASDIAKNRTDREKAFLEDDRLRDQARAEHLLKAIELMADKGATLDLAALDALMTRDPIPLPMPLAPPPAPPAPPAAMPVPEDAAGAAPGLPALPMPPGLGAGLRPGEAGGVPGLLGG